MFSRRNPDAVGSKNTEFPESRIKFSEIVKQRACNFRYNNYTSRSQTHNADGDEHNKHRRFKWPTFHKTTKQVWHRELKLF